MILRITVLVLVDLQTVLWKTEEAPGLHGNYCTKAGREDVS